MKEQRQQQKVLLSADARAKLRAEASARRYEMSEIVEHLIISEEYPKPKPEES